MTELSKGSDLIANGVEFSKLRRSQNLNFAQHTVQR